MPMYLFVGSESRSDNGIWEVVVKAPNRKAAKVAVIAHLTALGRRDLHHSVNTIYTEAEDANGVIYSNVER